MGIIVIDNSQMLTHCSYSGETMTRKSLFLLCFFSLTSLTACTFESTDPLDLKPSTASDQELYPGSVNCDVRLGYNVFDVFGLQQKYEDFKRERNLNEAPCGITQKFYNGEPVTQISLHTKPMIKAGGCMTSVAMLTLLIQCGNKIDTFKTALRANAARSFLVCSSGVFLYNRDRMLEQLEKLAEKAEKNGSLRPDPFSPNH